jgi:hypothetical protein
VAATAAFAQSPVVVGVDGGWAMLEMGDAGLLGTRYDFDGGVGATAVLGGFGAHFTGLPSEPWLAVVQWSDSPTDPITARWFEPGSWGLGNTANLTRTPTTALVWAAAVPGQVLIAWDVVGRRFQADGTPIDLADVPVLGNPLYGLYPFGPRYLAMGLTDAYLLGTDLTQAGPFPRPQCPSGFIPGPMSMCVGLNPAQAVQITWYDQALNAVGGPFLPGRRASAQSNPQLVAGRTQSWVAWNDDREGALRIFAARIDATGAISAPIAVAANVGLSPNYWWTAVVGDDLVVAPQPITNNSSVLRISFDAGLLLPAPLMPNAQISLSTGWVGVVDDVLIDLLWTTDSLPCPFAPYVMRELFDGGLPDNGWIRLGCGGFGYIPSGVVVDGGVWFVDSYGASQADGGFSEVGDIYFVPAHDPPTTFLSGVPLNPGFMQPPMPLPGALCYARHDPTALECAGYDGGFTDVLLNGSSVAIVHDGRRFHVLGCESDGGSYAAVVRDDGGVRNNANAPGSCPPPYMALVALGPDHLGYVLEQRVDAGDDVVTGSFLYDYFERDEGAACVSGTECLSGFCSDGVCCDSACGFSAGVCQTCAPDGHCRMAATCDGGSVTTDGGLEPRRLEVGCGCGAGAQLPLLGLAGLTLSRRRRTTRYGRP